MVKVFVRSVVLYGSETWTLLRITLEGRIQGEKVVEDQEQCSWIGY